MRSFRIISPIVCFLTVMIATAFGAVGSREVARLLIPEPQLIETTEGSFLLTPATPVVLDNRATESCMAAARAVRERLVEILGSSPEIEVGDERGGVIFLTVSPDLPEVKPEGYELDIAPYGVRIIGIDPAGLYYGAATLIQLLSGRWPGGVRLPCVEIKDWPDLPLRAVHYDLKHHQDRFENLKDIINRLSLYKINGFVLELEDKFAYPRHPEIGAPGALSPDQLRALWNYAAERHVEIIPLVQGLGHVSYILKHPEHAELREVEDSPWQFCPYKPRSMELLTDLYQDVLDVLPGGNYFHIGGDESYELGMCPVCRDRMEATGCGTIYLDWLLPAIDYLAQRGRRVMLWDDMILQFGDESIERLPRDIVYCRWNYDTRKVEQPRLFELGFPVVVCPATQCVTPLFPDYENRLPNIAYFISSGRKLGAEGSLTTSWDDSGCHQESFWYGFACAAEYSWTGGFPTLDRYRAKFMEIFYGTDAEDMIFVYNVLSQAGELWTAMRGGPFWYRWYRGTGGQIPLPPVPGDSLQVSGEWMERYRTNSLIARNQLGLLEAAVEVLNENVRRDGPHRYNLEVLRSVAKYAAYSAWAVAGLGRIDELFRRAGERHAEADHAAAAEALEEALELARLFEPEGRFAFNDLIKVWETSRLPKGMSDGDREYLHMTDLAGHLANARVDMTYLRLVEEAWDLSEYIGNLEGFIQRYRQRHDL